MRIKIEGNLTPTQYVVRLDGVLTIVNTASSDKSYFACKVDAITVFISRSDSSDILFNSSIQHTSFTALADAVKFAKKFKTMLDAVKAP